MSRPRYWWYGSVKKAIMQASRLELEEYEESKKFTEAIVAALEVTMEMQNGEKRVEAVKNILIDQSESVHSQADKLFYSDRVVIGWINDFVNLVGKYKGYI